MTETFRGFSQLLRELRCNVFKEVRDEPFHVRPTYEILVYPRISFEVA
jgi:hypothetical protein